MGVSLFNKYRPQTFGDVIGQKAAVEIITNSITRNTVSHAYLFSGSRGCGKTSAARIFAKALNCKNPKGFEPCGECENCTAITAGESLDVIEIDGASNNGVENIRGLKENVTLAPFNSKWKIYIIDEVHMLSTGAFNALLKTLEEPPEYVIFIMATTEPQKVPVTIRSRCQHIPFHSITPEDIYSRLNYVCECEEIKNAESDALWEISRQADGALRDALSLLEQVIASGDITLENVERITGAGSRTAFERFIRTFRAEPPEGYIMLKSMFDSGASGLRVFEEMFSLVRNLWLISEWKNIEDKLGASEQEKAFLKEEASNWKTEDLNALLNVIVRILSEARRGVKPDILLGMFMLFLEGSPEVRLTQQIQEIDIPRVTTRTEPIKAEPVKTELLNDEVLKDKLLDKALTKNFLIHCWLYASDVNDDNGVLTVSVRHSYSWSYMKTERNAAELREIFPEYKDIIVQYEDKKIICRKLLYKNEKPAEADLTLNTKIEEKSEEQLKPEEIDPEIQLEIQPVIKSEDTKPKVSSSTKIDEFLSGLRLAGLKTEEILRIEKSVSDEDIPEEGEPEE